MPRPLESQDFDRDAPIIQAGFASPKASRRPTRRACQGRGAHGGRGLKTPPRARQAFLMPIEDVFTITGRVSHRRSVVLSVASCPSTRGRDLGIREPQKTTAGIEMFHKSMDEAWAGENCGLLLRGTKSSDDEQPGCGVPAPSRLTPTSRARSTSKKEEGGRQPVLLELLSASSTFRTTDVTGVITPRGHRHGHAWRHHRDLRPADPADRHGAWPRFHP